MHDQEGSSTETSSSSPAACWWPETITSSTNSSSILMSSSGSASWNSIWTTTHHNQQQQQLPSDHHQDTTQLWNHLLLEGMQQKNSFIRSTLMFDPACDYLKKLDGGWEFASNISPLSSLEKQLISVDMADSTTGTNLTDLVSNWSIAPPNPHQYFDRRRMMNPNSTPPDHNIKHDVATNGVSTFPAPPAFHSYLDHDNDVQLVDENGGLISNFVNQIGPVIGLKNRGLMEDTNSWSVVNSNSLPRNNLSADFISFSPLLMNKPAALMELRGSASSSDHGINKKAAGHHGQTSSSSRKGGGGRGSGTGGAGEGKKKRSSDHSCTSDNLFKKPKHDTSPQIIKSQVSPKVKVGDKITALQQIVSPFGKTDTASVLLEAIKYIRFLQEQVQLLSDPYLKSNANKDHNSWPGSMERKEKADSKHDLRGRGLCLVPISCTPQAYRENSGPDYWTPPFRGCLYR